MSVQVCWNCHKETEISPPDYHCTFCQTVLKPEEGTKLYQNEVIIPKGLSEVPEKPSIKSMIDLSKPPLPWELEPVIAKEEKKTEPEIIPVIIPEVKDLPQETPPVPEKQTPFLDIPVQKHNPEPLDNHTFIYSPPVNPVVHEEPVFIPEEKTVFSPPQEDLIMKDLLKEMEEKDRKLREFLEEGMDKKEEKPIAEEEPEWKKLLRETEEKEKKLNEFLQPAVANLPKIPNTNPDKKGKPVTGWLIRHTENTEPVYYELFDGENIIGRADNVHPVDVEITGDNFVSRGHAVLRVFSVPPDIFIYEIRDDGSKRADKSPSLNGTYVNGNRTRVPASETYYLHDGDTIQIGVTKLVLKAKRNPMAKPEEAAGEVLTKGYTQTVHFK
ncbi:MAG: FHA domain-containing protein [Bacteroidia bacterium]|nr:FHA domain-containing protein [Bacteroidia bacterium]